MDIRYLFSLAMIEGEEKNFEKDIEEIKDIFSKLMIKEINNNFQPSATLILREDIPSTFQDKIIKENISVEKTV